VICALNGQVHAALAALRSSLEALVYHYWWRRKLFLAGDNEAFYKWFFGKERNARFAAVISDTLNDLPRPAQAVVFDELRAVYSQLCSYAHKATLDEATAKLAGIAREQAEEHPCGRLEARCHIASVRRSPCADVGGSEPKPRADKLRDEQDPDGASPRPDPENDLNAHLRPTQPKRSEGAERGKICVAGEKHDGSLGGEAEKQTAEHPEAG
jgi:hypothetical protein